MSTRSESSKIGGPSRRKDLLDDVVAGLEHELRCRQQQLVEETAKNARAKAQLDLLNALALASTALKQLTAAEAAGNLHCPSTQPALDALDQQLQALIGSIDRAAASSGGGGGSGRTVSTQTDASTASEAISSTGRQLPARPLARGPHTGQGPPGLVGTPVAALLMDIVSGRGLIGSKDEFVAFWGQSIMQLAMTAHQYKTGAVARDALEKIVRDMGVRFGALFLYGSYTMEIIVLDLETGQAGEAPQSLWDRVAACLALSPDQTLMFLTLGRWWRSTTEAFHRERQELAQRALAAPADFELQEALATGLERVNSAYLASGVAVLAVTLLGVTRPEQVADSWIACWPRMPLMTAIFDSLDRQKQLS